MKNNQIERGKALLLFGIIVSMGSELTWMFGGLLFGIIGLFMVLFNKGD